MINNIMSLYSSNLKTIVPGEYTQPYKHATKLFVADTFRLAPKHSYLYYVVFEIDPSQTELGGGLLNSTLEFANRYNQLETGMLVKDIDLPKFNISTKTLNAYNRKNIIQTNITYDAISVTFHDDAANVITKFWNDYYTYYYRDSDYTSESYGVSDKYTRRSADGWGYSPRNRSTTSFLKSIRIFSLHNKNFTEYYLVNPIINSWRHGRHEAASNTGILENSMTISYETVKYYTGFVNPVNVDGFSLLHYDNQKSPIAGDFFGDIDTVGALNLIDGAPKDLRKPDGSQGAGGPLSSIITAFRTYQNLKNSNLKDATPSIAALGSSIINDVINGRVSFPTDTTNSSSRYINNFAGSSTTYASGGLLSRVTNASGDPAGIFIDGAINASAATLGAVGSNLSRGITDPLNGAIPASGQYTRVYDVAGGVGSGIFINPGSMQPQTGTYTAYVTDSSGNKISEFTVSGTSAGNYDPNNQSLNLTYSQLVTDAEGRDVIKATYQNGTIVIFDPITGDPLGQVPGSEVVPIVSADGVDTNPVDTRNIIAAGGSVASTAKQVITNTANGVVSAVGGIATARIVDLGGAAGTLLGSRFGATGAAVGGLIGRALTKEIATRSGDQIGRAISGGITPIFDKITGSINQGIENIAGGIKNVVGSWTGLGGYNPAAPYDNLVSTIFDPDGSVTEIYKNGDTIFKSAGGDVTFTKGSSTLGTGSFFNNIFGKNIDAAGPSIGPSFGTIWTDSSGRPILDGSGEYIFSSGDINFQSPEADSYSVLGFGGVGESYGSFYGVYDSGGVGIDDGYFIGSSLSGNDVAQFGEESFDFSIDDWQW